MGEGTKAIRLGFSCCISTCVVRCLMVPQAQRDATFGILAKLRAELDTPAFPTADVDLATRDFFELLDHLAIVIWQDLSVADFMSRHVVFTKPPFSDDQFGFLTFRGKVRSAMRDAPSSHVEVAVFEARRDGDLRTARMLTHLQRAIAGGPPGASTQSRIVTETHRMVTALTTRVEGSQGRLTIEVHGAGRASVVPVAAATAAAPAVGPLGVIPSDSSTWPSVSANGILPTFATAFEFALVSRDDQSCRSTTAVKPPFVPGVGCRSRASWNSRPSTSREPLTGIRACGAPRCVSSN